MHNYKTFIYSKCLLFYKNILEGENDVEGGGEDIGWGGGGE